MIATSIWANMYIWFVGHLGSGEEYHTDNSIFCFMYHMSLTFEVNILPVQEPE